MERTATSKVVQGRNWHYSPLASISSKFEAIVPPMERIQSYSSLYTIHEPDPTNTRPSIRVDQDNIYNSSFIPTEADSYSSLYFDDLIPYQLNSFSREIVASIPMERNNYVGNYERLNYHGTGHELGHNSYSLYSPLVQNNFDQQLEFQVSPNIFPNLSSSNTQYPTSNIYHDYEKQSPEITTNFNSPEWNYSIESEINYASSGEYYSTSTSSPGSPWVSQTLNQREELYQPRYQEKVNYSRSPSQRIATSQSQVSYTPRSNLINSHRRASISTNYHYQNIQSEPPSYQTVQESINMITPKSIPIVTTSIIKDSSFFSSQVKPFFARLVYLLDNSNSFGEIIRWDNQGKTILINSLHSELIDEILPTYFSHRSLQSFLRQFVIYEFTRVSTNSVKRIINRDDTFHLGHNINNSNSFLGYRHSSFRKTTPTFMYSSFLPTPSKARKERAEAKNSIKS